MFSRSKIDSVIPENTSPARIKLCVKADIELEESHGNSLNSIISSML